MNTLKSKRNHLLDIARIVAILSVVMTHCSTNFVSGYNPSMSEFVFGNLFNSISRIGVPLFLMISGALFLDEKNKATIKSMISKNVKNLAIITIVWAFIYAIANDVVFPIFKGEAVDIKSVFTAILNGHYHMWYLYMIIGLYIITPFFKKFVYKENKEMVLFFIFVSFVVQFLLPIIDKLCIRYLDLNFIGCWIEKFHLDFFGGYITYFLVGWYIVHIRIPQKPLKYTIYLLGLLSLATIIFYVQYTGDYQYAYHNLGAPVFLFSTSVFLALNNIKITLKEKTVQKLEKISKLTFGVYIIHALILDIFCTLLPYSQYCILYILLLFVLVVCSSFIFSYVISKIPFIKKIIRA